MGEQQLPGLESPAIGGSTEHFPTPPALCEAVCRVVKELVACDELDVRNIVEPSAGTGNFVRAARAAWPEAHLVAVDVIDAAKECMEAGANAFCRGDFVEHARRQASEEIQLVIGNPPFSLAVPHIEAGLHRILEPGGMLAFVLRLSFFESEARYSFWKRYPLRAFAPIVQRPSFTGDGKGDKTGVGLFIWSGGAPDNLRGELLPPISWR